MNNPTTRSLLSVGCMCMWSTVFCVLRRVVTGQTGTVSQPWRHVLLMEVAHTHRSGSHRKGRWYRSM